MPPAEDVILPSPRLLSQTPRRIPEERRPARALLKTPLDWRKLAAASLLASPCRTRGSLADECRARNTPESGDPARFLKDEHGSSELLEPDARGVCRELASAGLWPEALDEILRRNPPGGPSLQEQSAEYLINLSRLAGKASRYNVEIWAAWAAIRKTGWQYELAVVERAIGGTVFSRIYPRHFASQVTRWSVANRLDPLLVHALIRQESAYNRSVASWAGAVGLMQLMPSTAAGIATSLGLSQYELKDPDTNIRLVQHAPLAARDLREQRSGHPDRIQLGSGQHRPLEECYRARWDSNRHWRAIPKRFPTTRPKLHQTRPQT